MYDSYVAQLKISFAYSFTTYYLANIHVETEKYHKETSSLDFSGMSEVGMS